MTRRKQRAIPLSQRPVLDLVLAKARPPLAVVLGSPGETAHLLEAIGPLDTVCYQQDLYQADRLTEEPHRRRECTDRMAKPGKALQGADELRFGTGRRQIKRRLQRGVKSVAPWRRGQDSASPRPSP